jgi:hypothetical protein
MLAGMVSAVKPQWGGQGVVVLVDFISVYAMHAGRLRVPRCLQNRLILSRGKKRNQQACWQVW